MKIAQIAVSKYMQKGMFARHKAKSAITVPGTIILRPSAGLAGIKTGLVITDKVAVIVLQRNAQ